MSARDMLAQIVSGEIDPKAVAELARGRLRSKRVELEQALTGLMRPRYRFLISEHLSHLDHLEDMIVSVDAHIEEMLHPLDEELALLVTIPGAGQLAAETLLAEIGWDMGRFPSARHLASWAGICPGNSESAGKRKTGRARKGSPSLRRALVEAAHAASHTKDTYLSAQYHRLVTRRGNKKAIVAVAHSILVCSYHMLTRKEPYHELGTDYFDRRNLDAVKQRLVNHLQDLGYQVQLSPLTKAA